MTARRSWVAYAAVCTPLVLLAAVTYMTWRTEQGFRRVSDRVVHDYAAIAAWQLARRAGTALHDEVMAVLDSVAPAHARMRPGEPLPSPERLLRKDQRSASAFLQRAGFAFSCTAPLKTASRGPRMRRQSMSPLFTLLTPATDVTC